MKSYCNIRLIHLPLLLLALLVSSCSHASRDSSKTKPWSVKKGRGYPIIVIDAGHGGHDQGTQSQMYKYQEKHLTLATAMMVKDHLENLGYKVVMTRRRDIFIPLENRAKAANKPRNTLFVSIHFNAAANRKAEGVEVFFYQENDSGDKERSKASKRLANSVLNDIIKSTHAPSRGIKKGNFHVIRKTTIPSILVEGGFLTNKNEMIKLKDPKYLNRIAWGVAKGIENYLQNEA